MKYKIEIWLFSGILLVYGFGLFFGLLVFWPQCLAFFPVCTSASLHVQRPKYKLEKRPNIEAKRPRGQKREAKNERPKWHFKYTQYNATGKKTCPSLSEASDRLSVPYQLSLFTHPDANDRLSVPHQLSLFTQPRIPEELSQQVKISNLGWCKFIESLEFLLCCIKIFY